MHFIQDFKTIHEGNRDANNNSTNVDKKLTFHDWDLNDKRL